MCAGVLQTDNVSCVQEFYKPFGIKYKGLKLLDVAQTNIALHFNEVAEFIDEALAGGGRDNHFKVIASRVASFQICWEVCEAFFFFFFIVNLLLNAII